jgi:hypothetical protein
MKMQRVKTPMAARALAVLAAGLSLACAGKPDASPPSPPASDYEVYATVLRDHFVNPPQDEHGDGAVLTCASHPPVGYIPIVGQTRLRREGGGSRDSSLAAELPPEAAPLVGTLRGMDEQPPRTLYADSFSVGVPVRLVPGLPEPDNTTAGPWPITLSRVAYSADGAWALVHAVQPCRAAYDEALADEEDLPAPGTAVVAALQRRNGGWVVVKPVFVYVE